MQDVRAPRSALLRPSIRTHPGTAWAREGRGPLSALRRRCVLPLRCPTLRDPRSQTPGRWPGVWESSPQVTIPKVTCGSIGRLGSTLPEPCSSHVGECGFSRPLAMAGKPGPFPYLRRRIRPRLHGSSATHAIYRNGTALASRSWGSPSLQLQIFPFPYSSSKSSVVCCLPFPLRVVYLAPFVFIRYCVLAALYDASRRIELFSAFRPALLFFYDILLAARPPWLPSSSRSRPSRGSW